MLHRPGALPSLSRCMARWTSALEGGREGGSYLYMHMEYAIRVITFRVMLLFAPLSVSSVGII